MKSKLSWIPFVPLALIAFFLKLVQGLFPEGAILGLSSLQLEYFSLIAVGLIFLFSVLFCMLDRKISSYYVTHRNVFAGIVGIVLAVLLAGDAAIMLLRIINSGKPDVLNILNAALSLISAVVFIVFSLNQSFRNRDGKRMALLNVIPAIMCGVRMILCFVGFTTISIRLADVSSLICYIFATMFFFYYAVVLSQIKTKSAVKLCFIFGLPAVAAMIPYGVSKLIFSFDTEDVFNNLYPLEILLFGLYIFAVLIEMHLFVRDRKSMVVDSGESIQMDHTDEKIDEFLVNNISEDKEDKEDDSSAEIRDTNDFLYQEQAPEESAQTEKTEVQKDVEGYLVNVVEDSEDDERPKNYEDRLDDIDKLILDITGQSD